MSSLKEMKEWCESNHREFWEYMLEDDINDREVSKAASMAEMERAFDVMLETIHSYNHKEKSASGLVGGDGARLEQYRKTAEEA